MALLRRTGSRAAALPASPVFRCENGAPSQQHLGQYPGQGARVASAT